MTYTLSNLKWAPSIFEELRREMNRLSEGFGDEDTRSAFVPRVNFAETEKGYEVAVDLPGMKPDEVHVELRDGHLWITGERKQETQESGKTFHRVERRYGQFRRVISLGNEVDPDQVEANYKDGVLTIDVPKVSAAQPKRIEVKS